MKKIIILILAFFVLCGCTNINDLSHDEVIATINKESKRPNIYRMGYKYTLPRGLQVKSYKDFNEIISNDKETFYLYVDALSYYNKIKQEYKINKESYYSRQIEYEDKYGYVEINLLENSKYLVEIMYNYAKIEVIVEESRINSALLSSVNILKSIKYTDKIIDNLYGDNVLNYMEEEFNIFNTTSSDSKYVQIDNTYQEEEKEVQDTDFIN